MIRFSQTWLGAALPEFLSSAKRTTPSRDSRRSLVHGELVSVAGTQSAYAQANYPTPDAAASASADALSAATRTL